jgi:hypothetical protein
METHPDLVAIESIDKSCYDILECLEEVSNCCSSPVYPESDICIKCGEHCEIIKI